METANAFEQLRTPPIGISLTETPVLHYPRRMRETNDGRKRGMPEIHDNAILAV